MVLYRYGYGHGYRSKVTAEFKLMILREGGESDCHLTGDIATLLPHLWPAYLDFWILDSAESAAPILQDSAQTTAFQNKCHIPILVLPGRFTNNNPSNIVSSEDQRPQL